MNVVLFGAGAVGRGLLAPLFCRAGHAVTFFETNAWIVSELCRRTYIPTRTSPTSDIVFVGPCRALNPNPSADEYGEALDKYVEISDQIIAKADLIVISVRVENMPEAAESLAVALPRRDRSLPPVPIWVCENTPNAAGKFETMVDSDHVRAIYRSAIAETVVPEMPSDLRKVDPLLAYVDPRGYLAVDDGEAEIGKRNPYIKGVAYSSNFAFDWDLKWYCHCSLHAVVAFLGMKAGHTFIHEATGDKVIRAKADKMMEIVRERLSSKHGDFNVGGITFNRIEREWRQLSDPTRPDLCSRVARDAARKVQPGERLMDALALVGGKNAVIEEAIEFAKEFSGI